MPAFCAWCGNALPSIAVDDAADVDDAVDVDHAVDVDDGVGVVDGVGVDDAVDIAKGEPYYASSKNSL